MKKILFATISLILLISYSCNKGCNCTQSWQDDCNLIYHEGDKVQHNGICYKAFTQGKACAVEPGTIQGDIWEECH